MTDSLGNCRRRSERRTVIIGIALSLVAAACSSSHTAAKVSSTTSNSTSTTGSTTITTKPAPKADWSGCKDIAGFDCASVAVPLDYAKPAGKSIDIAMVRAPAGDKAKRIGSLFINPGGPGDSGIQAVQQLVTTLPQGLIDRFDIVGFDPRGVGKSSPIECITDKDTYYATWYDDKDPVQVLAAVKDRIARNTACATKHGDLLAYLTTVATAKDLDLMRAAVGDAKLTYLGFSYGTSLGGVYATLFPDNIRAMVLDGAVNPMSPAGEITPTGSSTTLPASDPSHQDFEAELKRFVDACAADTKCAVHANAKTVVDSLRKSIGAKPLTSRGPNASRPVTRGYLEIGIVSALYSEDTWAPLALGLSDATKGDGTILIGLADNYTQRRSDGSYSNIEDANRAIRCADDPHRPTQAEVEAKISTMKPGETFDDPPGAECIGLPAGTDPLPDVSAKLKVPVIVIGTKGDPATPYANTKLLADALGSGQVITWEGDGHTAFGQTDCVSNPATSYLVDLTMPVKDPDCPADTTAGGNTTGATDLRSPFVPDRAKLVSDISGLVVAAGAPEAMATCYSKGLIDSLDDEQLIRLLGNDVADNLVPKFQAIAQKCAGA